MKTEFTKEERHEIYKKAREFQELDNPPYSMCYCIAMSIDSDIEIDLNHLIYIFPEFNSIKPNRVGFGYWFDENDKEIRLQKFDELIKATQ